MNRRWLVLVTWIAGGCSDATDVTPSASAPTSATAAASVTAPAPSASAPPASSNAADVEPVYPRVVPTNATAERICKTLHELPSQRIGACCEAKPGTPFLGECTRTLSFAIDSGAVRVEEADIASCEAAQTKALEGCAWVRSSLNAPPTECRSMLVGTHTRGQACRSALECASGDTCLGLSATSLGVCGEPKPAKAMCQTAIDTLATYTFADLEKYHPECKGVCDKLRCRDLSPVGEACAHHLECGEANHCNAGTCRAGVAPISGAACSKELACGGGLRCIEGACALGAVEGAACKTNVDCLGTCTDGACKRACPGTVRLPGTKPK